MNNMEQVLAFASTLSVIIIAFIQLIKATVNVPKNLVPLIGLVVGLAVGAIASPFTDLDIGLRLWAGAFAGLSATGLFELVFNNRPGNTK